MLFDRLAQDTKLPTEKVRAYPMRHTYVSARLQTLDGGQPVSPFTVMKEVGHTSLKMIETVYGHVGQVRQRAEVVEFRFDPEEPLPAEAIPGA
jgi:integrase